MGWVIAAAAAFMAPNAMAAATETVEPTADTAAETAVAVDTGTEIEGAYMPLTPEPAVGIPDGRMGLQDQYTDIGQQAADFHNNWLLVLCVVISIFVLALLGYAMIRFRRSANPEPSRTSHNTMIEVIWTVVPVLILVAIAVPSIKLINAQYNAPPADVTVKVIGNQWYWTYEYPDHGVDLVSNMLKEQDDPTLAEGARYRTDADGPALLAVDERIVIPAGKTVKFLVTSADVIHAFAVPAFWTKMDAVPGRINETWVKVDRPGVYFGMCSELCGARHGYMPVAVEVVPEEQFNAWVASKGGSLPGVELAAEDAESEADAIEAGDEAGAEEAAEAAVEA
ncbi:cytochrome c oxidase subunit II [Sphingomicrobium sp. B8]|uniref:Cytochrome c oxidase subunit 2 n=2 Tax=Sphingomicrobium clamense TaxID=2851013 RepID=A0ABS6V3G5_9SPHN|nr:cytochrome c oxidase subunit II [Sphingomicrobium sp. B8]